MSTFAPVKLYVSEEYKEPKLFTYVELLFPFWGVAAKESMPYVRAAAMQYQYSKNDFTLVEHIQDCDYVLVPYQYDRLKTANPGLLARIIADAESARKPLLIDGSGDLEFPIDIPNATILRVSQYRYSAKSNEITIPFCAEDLLETYAGGLMQFQERQSTPSIGFTGWAQIPWKTRLHLFFKELPLSITEFFDRKRGSEHKGIFFRERALRALVKHSGVEAHFTARPTYSGHVKTIAGGVDDFRTSFVDNLLKSDYALVVRGDANASVRFYEVLSLGRIPVFVDTACVLPLEHLIAYRDFCVFIDWKDVERIGDILSEFHAKLSPKRFREMQQAARDAYRNYLRFDAFSKQLAQVLRARLRDGA